MKPRIIIVSAPSGAGKSSFVDRITREDQRLVDLITYTTRTPRPGESEGHPYFFLSKEEFQKKVRENFFVEWAQVHTNLYGTSFEGLEKSWKAGKTVIMDIDVQGYRTFKEKFPDTKGVFILPPSIDELRRRVIKRDQGKTSDLEVRMKNAEIEMKEASHFDCQIINDDFEVSYGEFKKILEEWLGPR